MQTLHNIVSHWRDKWEDGLQGRAEGGWPKRPKIWTVLSGKIGGGKGERGRRKRFGDLKTTEARRKADGHLEEDMRKFGQVSRGRMGGKMR